MSTCQFPTLLYHFQSFIKRPLTYVLPVSSTKRSIYRLSGMGMGDPIEDGQSRVPICLLPIVESPDVHVRCWRS